MYGNNGFQPISSCEDNNADGNCWVNVVVDEDPKFAGKHSSVKELFYDEIIPNGTILFCSLDSIHCGSANETQNVVTVYLELTLGQK